MAHSILNFNTCAHRGKPTGHRISCPTCKGSVQLLEHVCDHPAHGTTTSAACAICTHYQPKSDEVARQELPVIPPEYANHPPCSCTVESLAAANPPGWCPRHRKRMVPSMHRLCQNRPEYREIYECKGAGLAPLSPAREMDCMHLGEVLDRRDSACRQRWVRGCALHGRCTMNDHPTEDMRACALCRDYNPHLAAAPPPSPARPGDLPCGVVIGSYLFPKLAELQIRLIRAMCGPVPILVSADHSPDNPEKMPDFLRLEKDYPDVTVRTSSDRLGQTMGDLAAFHWGLIWARRRGLRVLAKLSQRFLVTVPYWLQDGAAALLAAGGYIGSQPCKAPAFPIRTEACLLDVDVWSADGILASLAAQTSTPAEHVVGGLAAQLGDKAFWRWPIMGEGRYVAARGIVWHCANSEREFHTLAHQYGIVLDNEFSTAGWNQLHKAGKHRFK